jgi:hypothetical protein
MQKRYLRHLISWIVALGLGLISFGEVTIKIRVVNVENGHPIQKQPISVSMLYEKTPPKYDATIRLETDANGGAQFGLPNGRVRMSTNSRSMTLYP